MKKIIILVIIILVLIGLYLGVYAYSLSKVEIKEIKINKLEEISSSEFTINGYCEVYNNGIIPVKVSHVEYIISLDKNNHTLATGFVQGGKIPPKESVKYPISNKVEWIPTSELLLEIITPGDTYATISGEVYVVFNIILPFTEKINLEEYIKQFITGQIEEFLK